MINKMTQLHIMDTWTAMDPAKLTREDRMKALSSLLFLKEKQTGKIKGRACVNGAPQWAYIPKEEAASPTVSMESTFIAVTIAAHKKSSTLLGHPKCVREYGRQQRRTYGTKKRAGGEMIQIAPQVYRKYVTVDRRETKVLYVKLQKALYGLMQASLLFYRKLCKELEEYRLTINPYDPCVANMITQDGKQLTVIWHVASLMASCKVDLELTTLSCYLANMYGPNVTMHTGRKHNYLGMDLEFNEDGTLNVSMITYLKNVIADFPEVIQGGEATPAYNHLFQIRDDIEAMLLGEEKSPGISSHGSTTTIHGNKSTSRHTSHCGTPDHPSADPR